MLTKEMLQKYIEDNPKKIRVTQSKRYPRLSVVKYKNKVFYDDLWDNVLEECRGMVVDHDFNTVIMPFRKVYNARERGTDIPKDEWVTVVRKVNGFMAGATYIHDMDKVVISTTGSLDSLFVEYAEDYITDYMRNQIKLHSYDNGKPFPITFLFEICHHKDPHVVPEDLGAYLIGMREAKLNGFEWKEQVVLDDYANILGAKRPEWSDQMQYKYACQAVKEVKHEGFMVHGQTTTLKLKSPYYKVIKLLGRMPEARLLERLQDPDKQFLRKVLDEEYYELIDHIAEVQQTFSVMEAQEKMAYIRKWIEDNND